jgi:hypothetical protein
MLERSRTREVFVFCGTPTALYIYVGENEVPFRTEGRSEYLDTLTVTNGRETKFAALELTNVTRM